MRILIKGGAIVLPDRVAEGDLFVDGETIVEVGQDLEAVHGSASMDRIIPADGCVVLPGGVDAHTHLDMPLEDFASTDDFETGTVAAAMGGTTTIVDYAERGETGLAEGLKRWMNKAQGKAVVDYGFHMTLKNLRGGVVEEMGDMVDRGVTSFKVFTAYPGRMMLTDDEIRAVMERASDLGAVVCVHAEDGPLIEDLVRRTRRAKALDPIDHALTRPSAGEAGAVARVAAMARTTGAPLVIPHISAAQAAAEVVRARSEGANVHGETCPQYLWLEQRRLRAGGLAGAALVCSPPLRDVTHMHSLWEHLSRGEIEMVGTDHCPFNLEGHKDRGLTPDGGFDFTRVPGGLPGIETRILLIFVGGVLTGRFGLPKLAELVAAAPARIFGLWPRKGALLPGFDGDVAILDPEEYTSFDADRLHMRVDYSPYEGMEVAGAIRTVLSRGEVIVDEGRFVGSAGRGRFVKRSTYSTSTVERGGP